VQPDQEWDREFSFHPDMGQAYRLYSDWKQAETHLNSMSGRRTINYGTSPFADVARQHREMAEKGERYIAGDEATDLYYIDKMTNLATRYNAEHGVTKPIMKPHVEYDPLNRKSWTNGLFEK